MVQNAHFQHPHELLEQIKFIIEDLLYIYFFKSDKQSCMLFRCGVCYRCSGCSSSSHPNEGRPHHWLPHQRLPHHRWHNWCSRPSCKRLGRNEAIYIYIEITDPSVFLLLLKLINSLFWLINCINTERTHHAEARLCTDWWKHSWSWSSGGSGGCRGLKTQTDVTHYQINSKKKPLTL